MADLVKPTLPSCVDVPHAPVILFENAPTMAHMNGMFAITLSLELMRPGDGKITVQHTVAAYLRSNLQGMLSLRAAIDDVILLGTPPEGKAQ